MFLVLYDLSSALKNNLAPAFNKGIGFSDDLDNFGFKFLLRLLKIYPKIFVYGSLLQQGSERSLVLTYAKDPPNVSNRPAYEGSF